MSTAAETCTCDRQPRLTFVQGFVNGLFAGVDAVVRAIDGDRDV
jgi:hypothetical protein